MTPLAKPFAADILMCPKCNQPLRRVTANAGSFFMTCPNRTRIPAGIEIGPVALAARDHCGQVVHVVAVEGVAIVTPISKAQFESFRRSSPTAAQIYRELGII